MLVCISCIFKFYVIKDDVILRRFKREHLTNTPYYNCNNYNHKYYQHLLEAQQFSEVLW